MEHFDRQNDEIDALESIFENFHFDVEKRVGIISVEAELPENGIEISDSESLTKSRVNYLPPIKLKFKLQPNYPEKIAPLITLSSCWLNLSQLVSASVKIGLHRVVYKTKRLLTYKTQFLTFFTISWAPSRK